MFRTILHSDCNSFYASVECLHHPELREKPLAVGGDPEQRHGIILAKNQIAKRYHVQTGETLWEAKRKCPDLVILPPNYEAYLRFSRMAREIYLDYTDRVEPFGLDEAWLDVTASLGILGNGREIAEAIRRRIKYELGITVSIGISYNKVFAKLGSDYKKPDAITEIGRGNYRETAWPLPVSNLLYVGQSTRNQLKKLYISTIGDLASAPLRTLRAVFGKWGDILSCFANGLDNSPVALFCNQPTVKSIGNSTTAPRDLLNNEDIKIVLMVLADSVARRLREQGFQGKTVCISIRDNQLFSFTRQFTMDRYTSTADDITKHAYRLFCANYRWEHAVRSIGISISGLTGERIPIQTSLFSNEMKRAKAEKLDKTLDWVKSRFGSYAVRQAILLKDNSLSKFDPKNDHIIHPVGYF